MPQYSTRLACRSKIWFAVVALLTLMAACTSGPGPLPPTAMPEPTATLSTAPIITPTPASVLTAQPTQSPAGATPALPRGLLNLPAVPAAFHYEVLLRPANDPNGPDTEIRGVYRKGSWQQTAHTRTSNALAVPDQESVAISGTTFTRPAADPNWTRWPGISFDDAYGLTSPLTALRLYAMADQKAPGETVTLPGAPEPTARVQAAISGATIQQLMEAGAAALVPDPDKRSTLLEQVAPLNVPQTITYWVAKSGRIYQATATLVTAADPGRPAMPWMQATWRFSGYDDPAIAVAAPQHYQDAPGPDVTDQPQATPQATLNPDTVNLSVRVFAAPGQPAENLTVTVYPAGDNRQPIDWRNDANAQFNLPPGRYDVLVQMDYAQEWLRGLEVTAGSPLTRDVTFDFGTLQLSVLRGGKPIPVDIVTYPAGSRQNWVDWRSDNPATMRLRAGVYDVEIAYDDYKAHQTITGLQVKAGEKTSQTVNVNP